MFTLQTNDETIKQWQTSEKGKDVSFTVLKKELVSIDECEKHITIFYGFLDQEIDASPAAFISQILQQNNVKGLNDCYGSFIIIHYDKQKDSYLITNDALGDLAAHYTENNDSFHFSDMPKALLTETNAEINQQRILHFFALSNPQNNGSFFENIKQLNGGYYLTLKKDKLFQGQYYQPPTKINHKIKSIDTLSQKFLQLMQQAIKFQAQGEKRIGVMMSGGLDSTFVVANCLKTGIDVNAYSYVFPTMPQANESIWVDAMRKQKINSFTFSGEPYWPLKSPWHISSNSPYANPYRHIKQVVYQQVQHSRMKILLTGVFADHLYTGYIYWLVDQFKRKPISALKAFISNTKATGVINSLRQISPKKWSKKQKLNAPWLTPFAKKALQKKFKGYQKSSHPHAQQLSLAFGIATAQSAWLDNEYSLAHDIYIRHPFRDRRVVEFLMSVPAWVLGNNRQPKDFIRKTAKGLLPITIINRQKVTTLKPLFIKGVCEKEIVKVKKLLDSPKCTWHKYVQKQRIDNILNFPKRNHKDADLMLLWQCITYELWCKKIK